MPRAHAIRRALVGLLLAAPTTVGAGDLYLHLSGIPANLGGELRDESTASGSVDLADDVGTGLGLPVEGRAGIVLLGQRFSIGGAIFNHDVDDSDAGFGFAGVDFEPGSRFESKLRWVEAEYGYALLPLPMTRIELLGGIRLYRYEGTARGETLSGGAPLSADEERSAGGPLPHLGVGFELKPFDRLAVRATAKAMFLGVGGAEGNSLDIEATAGIRIGRYTEVGAGFRRFDLFVSLDDAATKLDLDYRGVTLYARFGL